MAKSVLVVEGNTKATCDLMRTLGAEPYGISYAVLIEQLAPGLCADVAYPIENGPDDLPNGKSLTDYDGIVFTGSALSCYEDGPQVSHQRDLAKAAFESRTPVFGSCWGMQIMTLALGGHVRATPTGRELGIGKAITLNKAGRDHPMFEGRPDTFDVLEVHKDEVDRLPQGAILLAGNAMSDVQAIIIERDGCSFWGVQYHPEFDFNTMAVVLKRLENLLVKEGLFATTEEVQQEIQNYRELHNDSAFQSRLEISKDVADPALRRLEITNWLNAQVLQDRPRAEA